MKREQSIALLISLYIHLIFLYLPITYNVKKTSEDVNTHYVYLVEGKDLKEGKRNVSNPIPTKNFSKGKIAQKTSTNMLNAQNMNNSTEEKTSVSKNITVFEGEKEKIEFDNTKPIENSSSNSLNEDGNVISSSIVAGNEKGGEVNLVNSGGGGSGKNSSSDNNFKNVILNAEFGRNGPSFRNKITPVYPLLAKKLGKVGEVVLLLSIDEKGNLKEIEVLKSDGYGFVESAIDALKKSKYNPAFLDGRPVSSKAKLTIKFVLK